MTQQFRVLAYHAISDLNAAPVIAKYSIRPESFEKQMRLLIRLGFRFVTLDQIAAARRGEAALPRRAMLLTFDDGYLDLAASAAPILHKLGIPAVLFAVGGQIGGTNAWDVAKGAPELSLLDGPVLASLGEAGIEVGAHSQTHADMTDDGVDLETETAGAAAALQAVGVPAPRAFAYPYGGHDEAARAAVARAGYAFAFTTDAGAADVAEVDPMRIPRLVVHAEDGSGLRFVGRVFRETLRLRADAHALR